MTSCYIEHKKSIRLHKKKGETNEYQNIDASGKYINLMADGDFEIIGVQCYIKNDEQKTKVASMTKGEIVTLKGKCTDVGEVFGYSLDIYLCIYQMLPWHCYQDLPSYH